MLDVILTDTLFFRPTGAFTTAIRFCYAKDRITGLRKYVVKKGACGNGKILWQLFNDFHVLKATFMQLGC